jgi:hypothetical protein
MVWILRARERAQMNATPPEAKPEYSRANSGSGGVFDGQGPPDPPSRRTRPSLGAAGVLAVAAFGALLLVIAEFTTLFVVRSATASASGTVASQSTGSHNSYALIPVALLALLLAVSGRRAAARAPWAAIAALGLLALLIALIGDLPDSHSAGLVGSATTHFTNAVSTPSAGLYLETLGAVALLIAGGLGVLLRSGTGRPEA